MEENKRTKSEYCSSKRSRILIRNALVKLMGEKDFDKITITDVVKEAGINRGTFYAHYKSTNEVLDKIQEEVGENMKQIFAYVEPEKFYLDIEGILVNVVNYLKGDREYYKMLLSLNNGGGFVAECKKNLIYMISGGDFFAGVRKNQKDFQYAVSFAVDGTAELIMETVAEKNALSLDELPSRVSKIIYRIMGPFI